MGKIKDAFLNFFNKNKGIQDSDYMSSEEEVNNFDYRHTYFLEDNTTCIIGNVKVVGQDSDRKSIYMAQVTFFTNDYGSIISSNQIMGFELPSYLDERMKTSKSYRNYILGQAAQRFYNSSILSRDGDFLEELYKDHAIHIGKFETDQNGTVIQINSPSRQSNDFFDRMAKGTISALNDKRQQIQTEIEQARRNRDYLNASRIDHNLEQMAVQDRQILNSRASNPYFIRSDSVFSPAYDAIYISPENYGYILRLRKCQQISSDNGTYLYTCFLNSVKNPNDAELLVGQNPPGYCVAFEVDETLDAIAQWSNSNWTTRLCSLLSISNLSRSTLNYIGKLDKQNGVMRNSRPFSDMLNRFYNANKERFEQDYAQRIL